MTEEMAMLRAAALIDNGQRANADGYTRTVGYASPVYTRPVGYTTIIYTAPIGDLATKSDVEAALEAAYKADKGGSTTNVNANKVHTSTSMSTSNTNITVNGMLPTDTAEPVAKKSFIDRIKEKPVLYGLIAVFLAIITFGLYKSKKG